MKKIIDDGTSLYEIITWIKENSSDELNIIIEDNSLYAAHPANIEVMRKAAQHLGKQILINRSSEKITEGSTTSSPIEEQPLEKKNEMNTDTPVEKIESTPDEEAKPVVTKKRRFSMKPKKVIFAFLLFLLLAGASAFAYVYYYLPRADVTIYVEERILDRSVDLVVDVNLEEVSVDDKKIPGRQMVVETEQSLTVDATGTKETGSVATGEVTINNFSEDSVRLPAGTLISSTISGTSRVFELVEGVTVPKVTITSPDPTTQVLNAGTITASVQAETYGVGFNAPANTSFAVSGYEKTKVFAENTSPFSGGTTEEVVIVTEENRSTALSQLQELAYAEAVSTLTKEAEDGHRFEESMVSHETSYINYSEEAGAEASSVTVSLKITSEAISFAEKDVKQFMKADIEENVPDGFALSRDDEVLVIEDVVEGEAGVLSITAKLSALVIPVLDTTIISDNLAGATTQVAEEYLTSIEHVEAYEVTFWPLLPEGIRRFPFIQDRLTIEVEVKE